MPAPGGCEHPAQLSTVGATPWFADISTVTNATFFSGAKSCIGTTEMPLRDGECRNRCVARVCEADFECELLASSAGDALIRGYLDKATAFSGADWCAGTAQMPLRYGKGQNCCAVQVWEADFQCDFPAQLSRRDPWFADISNKPWPFSAWIGAPGQPRWPWETAWAEIAAPCESAKPISKEGFHPWSLWSAESIPFHRGYFGYSSSFSRADSCFQTV